VNFARAFFPCLRFSALALLTGGLAGPARAADTSPLAGSPSAFAREQAGSAIHWQNWDEKTLKHAKDEGRPVYVFIGSFLSELSRATTQQSFATPEVIELLNQNFICVLVDRDEQPDIAACAQHYLRTVKQLDGWPAHLWLTPELQPFEGASYLPPSEEWGKASFIKIARQAKDAWTADPAACRARAKEAVNALLKPFPAIGATSSEKIPEKLAAAAKAWRDTADAAHGGFGESPKSPEPELLRFLLRQSPADKETALKTLRAIAAGAIHDPVDGGYFERATDAAWKMPYFQKTLTMQARLALAFLDAAQISGDKSFADAARSALDYTLLRLALPDGGFAAAQDGTGETAAGYFAWTAAEIDTALGAEAAAFKTAYGVVAAGNVSPEEDATGNLTGKNLLMRVTPLGEPAAEATLANAVAKLRIVRNQRPALHRDERATAGAHGLMLAALSRADAQLEGAKYLEAANRLYAFVQKELVTPTGALRRMKGSTSAAAPADYAALALGCREYSRSAKNKDADTLATQLLARANPLFYDATSGHYYAVPAELPVGIFTRAPAAVDTLSAESLALQAGAPADTAKALTAGLVATLENTPTAPGDVLLALALTQPVAARP